MVKKRSLKTTRKIEDAQDLARIIKRIKNTMRKDAGLSTDLERIPLLSWLLFLKWLDDWEIKRLREKKKKKEVCVPIIKEPFRWQDWAKVTTNKINSSPLTFVNNALLPHLASLKSESEEDPREIVALIFRDIKNPMESEILFNKVIKDINQINFNVSNQIHDLAFIYEMLLKGLRDASGNSGEFYTPRPVIRFIIEQLDPELGDNILDPAAGTGGFLVESIKFLLEKTNKSDPDTIKSINRSIHGIEKKSLPYLLCLMNLVLHTTPDLQLMRSISRKNTLTHLIDSLEESMDIIVTNPPFGGEEETSVLKNFPPEGKTTETSVLFLQYIMKRLKEGGKAAVIVPNGFLFGNGAARYVKEKLLTKFNLHHIVLLPEGVFAPYTPIPTNILFFDKGKSTKEIHYIKVPSPDSGKQYSKTNPIHAKYFASVKTQWDDKKGGLNSWVIPVEVFYDNGYDLSPQNPSQLSIFQKSNYKETVNKLIKSVNKLSTTIQNLERSINNLKDDDWNYKPLVDLIIEVSNERKEKVKLNKEYTFLGVSGEAKGVFSKEPVQGGEIKADHAYRVKEGDLIYNRLFAWKGSFGLVPSSSSNCYVSNEFPIFVPKNKRISTNYLIFYMSHPRFWAEVEHKSRGSTPVSRNRLHQDNFLNFIIPIPILEKIDEVEEKISDLFHLKNSLSKIKGELDHLFEDLPKQMVLEMFKAIK